MKISACIITKNEEKNIEKCITSLIPISEEIVVVDTGSVDNTVSICNKLGANVFHYNWNNDFSAAKNYALSKAVGDWIIFLDADEYIDEISVDKIKKLINTSKLNEFNVVAFKMINLDKETNKIIDEVFKIRMFKNKEISYEGAIHEHLNCRSGKFNILNLYKEITIYHTGYSSSIAQAKAKRNLEIMLNNLKNNDEDKKYYAYMSNCYFGLQDYNNTIKYAKLHMKSGITMPGLESSVYKNLIDSLYYIGESKENIEKEILNAIKKFPASPNFYCCYADFFLDNKQYSKALDNFLLALKYNEAYDNVEINLVTGILNQIYMKVGQIYELKNAYENAIEYYFKSLKIYKYEGTVLCSICSLLKNEESEEVIRILNGIYDINNQLDLKFLCYNLVKMNLGTVYSYYAVKYLKSNNDIIIRTYLFLFNKRYEEVFEELWILYEKNYDNNIAIFLVVISILIDKESYAKRVINIIRPSYKRILSSYLQRDNMNLINEDINDYVNILQIIINSGNVRILHNYLELKKYFEDNVNMRLVNIFKEYKMYCEALRELEVYLETLNHEESNNIYMGIGYLWYKLERYESALKCFSKALENGYNKNDIYEFIHSIENNQICIDNKEVRSIF